MEAEFSFAMQVMPMALGGMHTMTIAIAYENTNNVAFTETAAFRVTVNQPILFSHDKVELPKNITSGESFSLPVNAYNTGLTSIYNVKCTLEVPGLIAASAYLGNLEPQKSSDKTMSVFATTIDSSTKYGTTYGACVFTYEDANGEQFQESVEVKIEILEPVKETDEEKVKAEEEAKEQKSLSMVDFPLVRACDHRGFNDYYHHSEVFPNDEDAVTSRRQKCSPRLETAYKASYMASHWYMTLFSYTTKSCVSAPRPISFPFLMNSQNRKGKYHDQNQSTALLSSLFFGCLHRSIGRYRN